MKAKPSKPNPSAKPGGEMKYKNAADVVGGPISNDPMTGMNPDKGVTGTSKLPPVK